MGQAKKRAKEILELKEYQDYMRKNFDCSDWFYEDGSVIGKVSIKDSNHSFNYCLEIVNWTDKDYSFENTLNIYNINDEIEEFDDSEYKLNCEVKSFLQNLYKKDDFVEQFRNDLMNILPIKDFKNEIENDINRYDYSDDEIAEIDRLEQLYGEKPIENPVICDGCDGSGYHYLVTVEEYKENPNIELGGEIRCYKCGGEGKHEEGFVTSGKKYVPYKE